MMKTVSTAVAAVALVIAIAGIAFANDFPMAITGGHDIGPNDYGRPCTLIAAALDVKTEVFREAFSGVTLHKLARLAGGPASSSNKLIRPVQFTVNSTSQPPASRRSVPSPAPSQFRQSRPHRATHRQARG